MTELLISLGLVVALVAALQPAHSRSWRPGFDSRVDQDLARQRRELELLATFEPPASTTERHRSGRVPVLEHRRSTGREAFGETGRAA